MAPVDAGLTVNPAWWRPIVSAHRMSPHPTLFSLSRAFSEAAARCDEGSPQHVTLRSLTHATIVRLHPDRWNDPFVPLVPSALPAGIDDGQLQILRRIAETMDDSDDALLRARVSDLCWWHLDRGDLALRDAALTSYVAVPLTSRLWHPDGRDAIQRAIEISKRLREDGRPFLNAITEAIHARLRLATLEDRHFTVQLSKMARREGLVSRDARDGLAELAATLAAGAREQKERELEQAWEAEAAAWYTIDKKRDEANAALERRALSLAAQAVDRRNGTGGAPNTASHFVERAINALLELPHIYRAEHGVDQRITQLRAQLDDDRMSILESMGVISSGPLDITEYVAYARSHVSGLEPFDALIELGLVHQPATYERCVEQARESLREHPLLHLLGNEHYSETGQKLASTPGMSPSTEGGASEVDETTWSAMIRDHTTIIDLVVSALIAPALHAVNLQHRYSLQDLYELCTTNPWIPRGHEATWAQGLLNGLDGDFASAIAVLVPQIEHFVRVHLKKHGVHTLVTDDRGVETEKGLTRLLEEPTAVEVFGATLVFEIRATLTEKQGPNFRNTIAHGLTGDAVMVSRAPIYVWWIALNLVVRPHAAQRHQTEDDASADPVN